MEYEFSRPPFAGIFPGPNSGIDMVKKGKVEDLPNQQLKNIAQEIFLHPNFYNSNLLVSNMNEGFYLLKLMDSENQVEIKINELRVDAYIQPLLDFLKK